MKLTIYEEELIRRVKAMTDGEKRLALRECFDERQLWDELYRRSREKDKLICGIEKSMRMR